MLAALILMVAIGIGGQDGSQNDALRADDVVPSGVADGVRVGNASLVWLDAEANRWTSYAVRRGRVEAVAGDGEVVAGILGQASWGFPNTREAENWNLESEQAIICAYPWCPEALLVVYGPTPPNAAAPDGCPTGESAGEAGAFSQGSYGVMQIRAASHMDKLYAVTGTYDVDLLYDIEVNVAVGWIIYQDSGWAQWSCRPTP